MIMDYKLHRRVIRTYCSCSTPEQTQVADQYAKLAVLASAMDRFQKRMADRFVERLRQAAKKYQERLGVDYVSI